MFKTSALSGQSVDSAFKHMTWLLIQPYLQHIRKHLTCMASSGDGPEVYMQSFRKNDLETETELSNENANTLA
jgi:hypothetical protein